MSVRGHALRSGLVVVVLYIVAALVSAHWSPLARRPLLDGFVPPAPYRWVRPPPELADSNVAPTSGKARVPFGPEGSEGAFFATDDAQVTLIVPNDAFPPHPGSEEVEITIEPVDPASVGAPPDGLSVTGNVYLIRATYQPAGDRVRRLLAPFGSILTYPSLSTDLGTHSLVVSPDGRGWKETKSHDQHSTRQVDGRLRSLGYVAVASSALPSPGPGGASTPQGDSIPISIVIVVIAGVLLLAGMLLLGRGSGRGPGRSDRRRERL